MKQQIKWLAIKNVIIIFIVLSLVFSYSTNRYKVSLWIREHIYGDENPQASLREKEVTGLIDSTISKYQPLFMFYQVIVQDENFGLYITFISNEGNIYEYKGNDYDIDVPPGESITSPALLKALCKGRAQVDEPVSSVSSKSELQYYYFQLAQIADRDSYESAVVDNPDEGEYGLPFSNGHAGIYGFMYASNDEYIMQKFYSYSDGVTQRISDETALDIMDYLKIISN